MADALPITRRRLVQAAGAALGTAVAPIAASAAPLPAADPDAGLHALLDRFGEARAAWDATAEPEAEAEARALAACPPRPAAVQPLPREPDPEGEARRQAIIAAQDGWMRDRKAVEDAVGLTACRDASEAAGRTLTAIEDAIVSCQPRTVPGLVRKAAWMVDQMDLGLGVEELGKTFARQVAAFGAAV